MSEVSREELNGIRTTLTANESKASKRHLEIMLELNSGSHKFDELEAQQVSISESVSGSSKSDVRV